MAGLIILLNYKLCVICYLNNEYYDLHQAAMWTPQVTYMVRLVKECFWVQ